MNHQADLFEQKRRLRETLKQRRAIIGEQKREIYSEKIAKRLFEIEEILSAEMIFAYISYSSEVSTHTILKQLLAQGKKVVVPKIVGKEKMESQQLQSWDDLVPGSLGILTPSKGEIVNAAIDVAITPGLGFTEQGQRIGFGAGYYDRWFASHEVGLKIALAFEAQIVDSLPVEETDIPVDILLTEKRTTRI